MSPIVLIGIMALAPVVALLLLRVNAAIVFLSLCLGSVLVRFAGNDAQSFVNLFSSSASASSSTISIGLLLLPAVFTTLIMFGTVRGKFQLLLNILPALAVGLLVLLLAVPLLSPDLSGRVRATSVWHQIEQAQVLAIVVGSIISLLFLWLQRPKRGGHEKHERR